MAAVAVLRLPRRADPTVHGMFTDWNDMEKILHTLHNELKVAPEENPVLHTEVPLNSMANRERMTQIMFEIFNVHAMYMASQFVLHDGPRDGIWWRCVAHSAQLRRSRSASRHPSFGFGCPWSYRVSDEHPHWAHYDTELKSTAESPTRSRPTCSQTETSSLSPRTFLVARVFSQPSVIGKEASGVHDTSHRVDICKEMYVSVVLSGGTTKFQRICGITKELTTLTPSTMKVKVVAPPKWKYSVWTFTFQQSFPRFFSK